MGRIPEWPPQDSNPSPRLKDDKVALLVPSVLLPRAKQTNDVPTRRVEHLKKTFNSCIMGLLVKCCCVSSVNVNETAPYSNIGVEWEVEMI